MGEFERVRWAVFESKDTEEVAVVDIFERRLRRMQRRIGAWAQVVESWMVNNPCALVMVTLTYARVGDYQAGHIRNYMNRLRGMLKDDLLGWAWVAEIQKRGAVHYHMMVLISEGERVPMPDKQGHWEHGLSNVQRARTPYYLVAYAGKKGQKDFARYPRGSRTYAASIRFGDKTLKELYRRTAGLPGSGGVGGWRYRGSSVTEGYARGVLAKRGRW